MIAVCIATYNHEAYIAQAIESALRQVCDEEVCIYIGDDASTDGTQAVCERYAADQRIVYVRREKNLGLVSNTIDLYRRILKEGCDYIAMLDGDDYWTDEKKLQRQVDYLREHPEVGFVHTAAEGQGDETIPTGDMSQCYDRSGARQTNSTVLFRASTRISGIGLSTLRHLLAAYAIRLSAYSDGGLARAYFRITSIVRRSTNTLQKRTNQDMALAR